MCIGQGSPGTPASSSAAHRGAGHDKKSILLAQAKARRLVEEDERAAWRASRELSGKVIVVAVGCVWPCRINTCLRAAPQSQAGPDLAALFDTRTILRSSAIDVEVPARLVCCLRPLQCLLARV